MEQKDPNYSKTTADSDSKKNQRELKALKTLDNSPNDPIKRAVEKSKSTIKYPVTVNQFAKFSEGSESVKKGIVKNKKIPPEKSFFWYQTPTAQIPKYVADGNIRHLFDGIQRLKDSKPTGKHKINNKRLSIKAIEEFQKTVLPLDFRNLKKEVRKPKEKVINWLGVAIKITPDLVFTAEVDGQKIIGGIKLHFKSTKPFTRLQERIVAYLLQQYLEKTVAQDGEIVLPEFCLCIDVFGNHVTSAPVGTNIPKKEINLACKEYADLWELTNKK